MEKIDFSNIAKNYLDISTVQKSASEKLFNLLDIKQGESVLDVGCGTGNLTSKIKSLSNGRVVGIDVSEGMIKEAVKNFGSSGIEFIHKSVMDMNFNAEFDAIFCNSTFQWFNNLEASLNNLNSALKPGGRIAIQAPATRIYCPNFVSAVNGMAAANDELGKVFSAFKSPWLFLETSGNYAEEFETRGFKIAFSKIETQSSLYSVEKVFEIFSSGATAGYLNQDNYNVKIDNNYIEKFKNSIKEEFAKQADGKGLINLIFNRIYLLAFKL